MNRFNIFLQRPSFLVHDDSFENAGVRHRVPATSLSAHFKISSFRLESFSASSASEFGRFGERIDLGFSRDCIANITR